MFCKMQVSDLDPKKSNPYCYRSGFATLQKLLKNPSLYCLSYVFKRIVTGIFWERKNELALFKLFYSKSKSRSSVEGPEPTENGSAPQPWFLKLVSLREII